jgi:hypothetical protein
MTIVFIITAILALIGMFGLAYLDKIIRKLKKKN